MLLGPIFSLELITCARRARYYLLRTIYAVVLAFTLWGTYASSRTQLPSYNIHGVANVAKDFFRSFAALQLFTVLFLTPAMVAGAVAQERERRTIEYLFTSQLSNADIVLGKLGARLFNMALLLIAGIPVMALAMLLGGIPPAALLNLSLLTLETLAAAGALSIAVSVGRKRTRDAVIGAYVLLAALLIAPAIGYQFRFLTGTGWGGRLAWLVALVCKPVFEMNPFYVLVDMNSSSPAGDSLWVRLARVLACYGGFTVGCLALAIARVRSSYASTEGRGAVRRRFSFPAWRPGVWKRSMTWKEMFIEPAMGRLGWIGRLALFLLLISLAVPWLLAMMSYDRNGMPAYVTGVTIAIVCCLECFGLLMIAARAATSVTSEKERDCWVALLSTPLSAREIVGGKLLGNLYAIRWVAVFVLIFWLGALIFDPAFAPAVPVQMATWLLLLVYVSWLGIACSQWCRNSLRAMGTTLGLTLFLGGLYLPFAAVLAAMLLSVDNRATQALMMAPCIPYLLAFPAIFWSEHLQGRDVGNGDFTNLAYILGLLAYGFLTALLWTLSVNRFNQFSGRMPPFDPDRQEIYERP